jgi:hypothetical protein
MEMKKFEEFYSLCERTVSQQRLLGAEDSDIAYLLHGMIAAHPEEEYSPEQIGKLRDLSIKKESQKETERIIPEEELQLYLERAKDAMTEQYGKDGNRTSKLSFLIGWVTAPIKQIYTSEQLKRIFALADE